MVVHDQPNRTVVHFYNLNVRRISSFEDEVTPADNIRVELSVPFAKVGSVRLDSADKETPRGPIQFDAQRVGSETVVRFTILRLAISAIAIIEP
jgi:hypothetical protein